MAATALGDWSRARWAWNKIGMPVSLSDAPLDMNIGKTPIRVSPNENPEVVWCHRIDPARARIESIPTAESGRHYHYLLLHDGEPRGKRYYKGELLSVCDELDRLEISPFQTWVIDVVVPAENDLRALFDGVAREPSVALEDWTASLEILCKKCSLGEPHDHVDVVAGPWKTNRRIAIATKDDGVFEVLDDWKKLSAAREATEPKLLLP